MDFKPVIRQARSRWKVLLTAAALVVCTPFLLRAPASGVNHLMAELQAVGYGSVGKAVAAQAVWVLFATQPWSRPLIVQHSSGLELWLRLMHTQSPALVERSAAMLYSTISFEPQLGDPAAVRRLAAASSLPLCTTRCQGSLILAISSAATQAEALRELAASPALPTLLDWAGLAARSPSAQQDPFISTAAASLLTNMAALPAGRARMARHPALLEDLIAAMHTRADTRTAAAGRVGRAVQLAANLASDPALAEALSKTGHLDQLLERLLSRVEKGDTREQVPAQSQA